MGFRELIMMKKFPDVAMLLFKDPKVYNIMKWLSSVTRRKTFHSIPY